MLNFEKKLVRLFAKSIFMLKEKNQNFSHNKKSSPGTKELILYNDDLNSFEHVIQTLIMVCEFDPIQAEQCALIAHSKGNCIIKSGESRSLKSIQIELNLKGLKTEIL